MKSLIPFKDFGLSEKTFEDFYTMMEDFFKDKGLMDKKHFSGSFKLDVQEKEEAYIVEAELPGFKKEEICIDLKDDILSISAKKEEKIDEEKKNFVHKERKFASVKRSIYLEGALTEGGKAKLDNGVLTITLPKEKKALPPSPIAIE